MRKPFGLCCCGKTDGCFLCTLPNDVDLTNVNISFPSRIETGISDATGSAGGTYTGFNTGLGASFSSTWSTLQKQMIAPEIPAHITLRRRGVTPAVPGPIRLETGIGYNSALGVCQWLWNDIRAYHWVYHGGAYDTNDGGVFTPDFDWKHTWVPGVLEKHSDLHS